MRSRAGSLDHPHAGRRRSRPMAALHPPIEPHETGRLDVGDGQRIYWETCGEPAGRPALVLHGGPGSGCTPGMRRFFDPAAYRASCSTSALPGAASARQRRRRGSCRQHDTAPARPTSRRCANISVWSVGSSTASSWGSVLGLAYAERHPDRVSAIVLSHVGLSRHARHPLALPRRRPLLPRGLGEVPRRRRRGRRPTPTWCDAYPASWPTAIRPCDRKPRGTGATGRRR